MSCAFACRSPRWLSAWAPAARLLALGAIATVAAGLFAAPASAGGASQPEYWTVAELQEGQSFESGDGDYTFSDFSFSASGFDESAFGSYLVQQQEHGFKLILGFGDLFGPGTLEMVYTATAVGSYLMDSAAIPLVALYEATDPTPLAEVQWDAANGSTMSSSATGPPSFPFHGPSTNFEPVTSLLVEQVVTLSSGAGIVKVENSFGGEQIVPEPGSGLLVGMGLGVAAVQTTRRRGQIRA